MIHALVTPKAYFDEVVNNERMADIKKDDRPYKKGDTIILQEYDADKKLYTGREVNLTITTIARNIPREGLRRGFVFICFSADKPVENELPEGYGVSATIGKSEDDEHEPIVNEPVLVDKLSDLPDFLKGGDNVGAEALTSKPADPKPAKRR